MIFVVVVVFLTAYAQTVVGFGFALLAVPVLVLRLDVQQAVVVSAILGTVSSGLRSWSLRQYRDSRLVRTYLWWILLGAPAGLLLFVYANMEVLTVVIGVSVFVGIGVMLQGKDLRSVGPVLERVMGFISGILLTSTSTNGPPLVLGLQARRLAPDVFRSTIATIFFIAGLGSVVAFALLGELTMVVFVYAGVALPTVVLANRLGLVTADRIQPRVFRVLVLVLLVIAGASSILSAFDA